MKKDAPALYASALVAALDGLSRNQGEGVILRFVSKLGEEGKRSFLPKIIAEAERLLEKSELAHVARVRTRFPLTKDAQEAIKKIFKADAIRETHDESILGGVRVQVGDVVYDGTMRRQLERICKFAKLRMTEQ